LSVVEVECENQIHMKELFQVMAKERSNNHLKVS
jgi:hypothetical protein